MNNATAMRKVAMGWMVDFRLPITDDIVDWAEIHLQAAWDIRINSLATEIEADAVLCYLRFR